MSNSSPIAEHTQLKVGNAAVQHLENEARPDCIDEKKNTFNDTVDLKTTIRVIVFAIFVGLAGFLLNFDTGYGGTVLQMRSFQAAFADCTIVFNPETGISREVCTFSTIKQALQSLSSLFIGLGAALSGITATYIGRRGTIQAGCFVICIGAAGQMGTAGNYAAYVACKCVIGVGMGHIFTSAVPYGVEFVPPRQRGALIALYNLGYAFGMISVQAVCLGSSTILNNWAWKTPMLCQIPIALFYGTVILVFPESPRWLLVNGKEKEARQAFKNLYGSQITEEVADRQILLIKQGIQLDKEVSSTTSWVEIFSRRYAFRLSISLVVLLSNVVSGVFFVNAYGALFLGGIGVGSPFSVNLIMCACVLPGALMGPLIVEYLGRRLSQLIGYAFMGTFMLIIGAVNSGIGDATYVSRIVLVVFLCLWNCTYGGFISPSTWLIAAEVQSVRLRTYGQAFSMLMTFIFQFATLFYTPFMISPAYGNMGANIGYFYFGLNAIGFVLIFLMVPETARLSLEQIDELFNTSFRPWSTSLKKNKAIANGVDFRSA